MTAGRPVALVLGASAEAPPPGIEAAADVLDLRYAPDGGSLSASLPGAQALFFWHAERGELETAWPAAGDLRWIQTASAGVDGLLFPDLIDSDVVVTNARGVFDEPIAEWVIGAMLAFATGLHRSIADQQAGVWGEDRSTERLEGKHLTVVGPGPIGRATASRALALGMTVTLVGRSARHDETFGTVIGPEGFAEALGAADYVLDALPFTADNAELFDAAAFAAMRPSARFINVGRGDDGGRTRADRRPAERHDRRRGARCVRGGTAPGRQPVVGYAPGDRLATRERRRRGVGACRRAGVHRQRRSMGARRAVWST